MSRRQKLLAAAPALVIGCMTIYVASGASVVGSATGASSVGVVGSVSTSFSADPGLTGGTGATGCSDESVGITFKSAAGISNGCTITFSSNNGTGSRVVFDNNNAGAVDFFCADPDRVDSNGDGDVGDAGESDGAAARSCATDSNTVNDLIGTGNSLGSEGFGIALKSLSGDVGTAAGGGVSAADPTPLATDSVWAGIPDNGSAAALCTFGTAHATDSSCNFVFGALGKGATQGAGGYSGTLRITTELT
jgi:hypothetical protein